MSDITTIPYENNSRLGTPEEKINELEETETETVQKQPQPHTHTHWGKSKVSITQLRNNFNTKIHVTAFSKMGREKRIEKIPKE